MQIFTVIGLFILVMAVATSVIILSIFIFALNKDEYRICRQDLTKGKQYLVIYRILGYFATFLFVLFNILQWIRPSSEYWNMPILSPQVIVGMLAFGFLFAFVFYAHVIKRKVFKLLIQQRRPSTTVDNVACSDTATNNVVNTNN